MFKRNLTGTTEIDGETFEWHVHREPQWCTVDGWRGLALSIRHVDGQRDVIAEWPMPYLASNSVPYRQRPQVSAAMIKLAVKTAIDAGWDPMSRGRSMNVMVDL